MTTTRRQFLKATALGTGLTALSGLATLQAACESSDEPVLGVALVGLGNYSRGQLGPALKSTKHCRLAGVVTGDRSKGEQWAKEYGFDPSHIYSYDTFDDIAKDPDIDIVYVVLPNAMHAEYVIRAAKAGKHVITEKPMAVSVAECDAMIAACQTAGVKLGVGYRLHLEPHNQEMMRLGQEKVYGEIKLIEAAFGFRAFGWENWRFHRELAGGGAMMDVGVYCIQAACYVSGELPIEVTAQEIKTYPERFVDVDETILWQMRFPSGALANCSTSYAVNVHHLDVFCEKGNFGLSPAFGYDGLQGYRGEETLALGQLSEQALHMDHFVQVVRGKEPLKTPGEMGRRDMKIIEAIYQATATGQKVSLIWD